MTGETDLFSPDLQAELPQELLSLPLETDPMPRIKAERSKYQAALLKWLRSNHPAEAMQSMRDATHAVAECVPPNQERAFWWIACALLDCLAHDSLADDQRAMLLLSRIDLQMKSLLDEQPADTDATLHEMLYLIAHSQPVSDNVAKVKQVYALASLLPPEPIPYANTGQLQSAIRAQLEAAKENWEHCARDGSILQEFTAQLAQLTTMTGQLGASALRALCQHMQDATSRANDYEQIRRLGPEMAMALLLLGDGLEHYRDLDDEFNERRHILDQRIQIALAGSEQNERKFAELSTLQCQAESHNASVVLLGEISCDLQRAQQQLLDVFGDAGTVPASQLISRAGNPAWILRQARSCLCFLGQKQLEPLLLALEHAASYFAEGGKPESNQFRSIMAALGAMLKYVQGLIQKQNPETTQLGTALHDLQTLNLPAMAQLAGNRGEGTAEETARLPHKTDELLEVFLEEAREVLDNLRSSLKALQREPEDHELLVSIRRGFHTLKGSSRMVGLSDLSEAAWAVERAISKWLQAGNRSATPSLLKLVQNAESTFQGWIDSPSILSSAHFETGKLVANTQQAGSNFGAPQLIQPDIQPPPATQTAPAQPAAKAAEPSSIAIGSATLPQELFEIATQEATQYIASLSQYLNNLHTGRQPTIDNDLVRTVHTLASVYRTTGLVSVAELACALEQWLARRIGRPDAIDEKQLTLFAQSIAALQDMEASILKHYEPQARPDLVSLLNDSLPALPKIAIEAQPAPTVISTAQTVLEQDAAESPSSMLLPGTGKPVAQDDVDEQLLPIFLEEADELYPQISNSLRAWRAQPEDKLLGRSLQRNLHTLKGSARMAGAMRLGELTHRLEDKVAQAMQQVHHDTAFWDDLEIHLDQINGLIEQLREKQASSQTRINEAEAELQESTSAYYAAEAGNGRAPCTTLLRVRSDTVDNLVNEAGEISVSRSRIESELHEFRSGLLELAESASHLRKQLREIEIQAESQMQARTALAEASLEKFDPLEFDRFTRFQELTRFMNESVHDVHTIQQSLLKNLDEAGAALSGQAYLNRKLQQDLLEIRMVPFASIAERLYRVVRQTCKELNKKANLELQGTDIEVDRSMLEKMAAPFEHLLRNSIAHGLEDYEQRKQADKSPIGDIRLALHQEGNEVVFEYSDDGAGMDFDALRHKASIMGLLPEGMEASDEQVMQMVFTSGLTTAAKVTEVSGRGVGMDVVRSEISALGGRITAFSERGKGVHFLIHLPLTLAASHVLMVRAGQETYAIPSAMAEQVLQAKPAELEGIYHRNEVEWQGKTYPVRYLPLLLGREECSPESKIYNRILLLHSGEQRLALHTDEVIGKQEVVVKKIGQQLSHVSGMMGATILGNGRVVLIINPIQLAQREQGTHSPPSIVEPAPAAPLVMVVDDSLTVRKITSRLLARTGYQVATAKDGVDALEQLNEITPTVLLLDIEMPRMDGFELTRRLRQDPKTKELPIIIITSRTADKHRDYAQELGVNAYLGKPYQESELLQQIARYAAASATEKSLTSPDDMG